MYSESDATLPSVFRYVLNSSTSLAKAQNIFHQESSSGVLIVNLGCQQQNTQDSLHGQFLMCCLINLYYLLLLYCNCITVNRT